MTAANVRRMVPRFETMAMLALVLAVVATVGLTVSLHRTSAVDHRTQVDAAVATRYSCRFQALVLGVHAETMYEQGLQAEYRRNPRPNCNADGSVRSSK